MTRSVDGRFFYSRLSIPAILAVFLFASTLSAAPDFRDTRKTRFNEPQSISLSGATSMTPGTKSEYSQQVQNLSLSSAINAGDISPPARCTGLGDLVSISLEDWESGLGSWNVSHIATKPPAFDTPDWAVVDSLPDSRSGSAAFVPNLDIGDCETDDESGVLFLESPAILIPALADVPRLSINHWIESEFLFDGGNLKISVDGGPWTLIPASAFEVGPYNQELATAAQFNTNPLESQPAFTGPGGGESGAWGESHINLFGIAAPGNTVRLRLDFGIDGCGGVTGWYVDEIEFYRCSLELPPSDCGNGILDSGEQCDDGNTLLGDGCSNACEVESGWVCSAPIPPGNITDPGFELGTPNPSWDEFSRFYGTPICDTATCGTGPGSGPLEGDYWVWFGGTTGYEEGYVAQDVIIPEELTTLTFSLEASECGQPEDYTEVLVDGVQVALVDGTSPICGQLGYTTFSADISPFADGGTHEIRFHSEVFYELGQRSYFYLDEIALPGIPSECRLPSLTLVKVLPNDDGGAATQDEFQAYIDGSPVDWGAPVTLYPGNYTASEDSLPGYLPSSWSGACADDGTVTLSAGDDLTCTITNDDIAPTLTLIKNVSNNDDGFAGPNDFGLTVNGAGVTSGAANAFDAGTLLTIDEAGLAGYRFVSITGDAKCPADLGGSMTLEPGENVTCTITNDDVPTATLTATDSTAAESPLGTGEFRVTLSTPSAGTTTVAYTVDGTATAGSDFVALTNSVGIADGATTATIMVTPLDDLSVEPDETVILTLVTGVEYTVGSPSTDTVTITSDDVPSATILANDSAAAENPIDAGQFTVTLDAPSIGTTTVYYAAGGTATPVSDYTALPGSVSIADGETSTTISVSPFDDAEFEGDETVIVPLSAGTGYTVGSPGSAVVVIADDDVPTATVTASDAEASESPLDLGEFVITLDAPSVGTTTIAYLVGGTATSGNDFMALTGSVDITDGNTTATIPLTPLDDLLVEDDETVTVTLAVGAGYTIGAPSTAAVTISSDDLPEATVTATDNTAAENPVDTGAFTVTLDAPALAATTVNFTVSGSATPNIDYTALTGSVVIAEGETSAIITVTPLNESDVEGDETVVVTLAAGDAYTVGSPSSDTVTISSDDLPEATVTATDNTAAENPVDTGAFTVTLDAPALAATTVNFTVSGSATPNIDYTALTGSVVIAEGETSAIITVTPLDESDVEGDETVVVTLAAGDAYTVGSPSSDTVTISSEDLPEATVTATDNTAAEAGSDSGEIVINLSAPSIGTMTLTYTVSGTATPDSDYTALPGSIEISDGNSVATILITPIDDTEPEGDESVIVNLESGAGYTVGSPGDATVVIADDDVPTATVAASDSAAAEDPLDSGLFTVTLDAPSVGTTTVGYTVSGTAIPGVDYSELAGSIEIADGKSSATIAVDPINDTDVEDDETVILSLNPGAGYSVGTPASDTVTINSEDVILEDLIFSDGFEAQ